MPYSAVLDSKARDEIYFLYFFFIIDLGKEKCIIADSNKELPRFYC